MQHRTYLDNIERNNEGAGQIGNEMRCDDDNAGGGANDGQATRAGEGNDAGLAIDPDLLGDRDAG